MLYEDDVVNAVKDYLVTRGWTIESFAHSTQHGDDIVASRLGQKLVVEAKGEGSGKEGTSRYGSVFTGNQVGSHVAVAVLRALGVASTGSATPALAFPANAHHKARVENVWSALERLGVVVFWVSPDKEVEVSGSLSGP